MFVTFVHTSIAYNGFVLFRIAAELKQRRKAMSGEKRKEVSGTAAEPTGEEAADLPRTMERMSRKGRDGDGKSISGKALEERDPGTVMLDDSVLKLIQAKHSYVFLIQLLQEFIPVTCHVFVSTRFWKVVFV